MCFCIPAVTSPPSVDSLTCWPHGCAHRPLAPWLCYSSAHARSLDGAETISSSSRPRRALPHTHTHTRAHTHALTQTYTHMQTEYGQASKQSHVWDCLIVTLQNLDAPQPQESSWWAFAANFTATSGRHHSGIFWVSCPQRSHCFVFVVLLPPLLPLQRF